MDVERYRRIEAIFEAALALPPEHRATYLDKTCGEDVELRAEVETLLAEDAAESPIDHGLKTSDVAAAIDSTLPDDEPDEEPTIANYSIVRRIGEGGMGIVYLAEQHRPVKRRVAIKLIKRGMDSKRVLARFESERQALALMRHVNIAAVHDAGITDDGRSYFVMENVEGLHITTYCDRFKLDIAQRLDLFRQVCDAIQHAHQNGIIHRDIKPSNVIVCEDGERRVPKVIDFGVAKATNQRLTEHSMYTEYGQIIGTPAYMSPEQAEMTGLDVDTRSDIYSLGVMLYELLTGTPPFDPSTLASGSIADMQRKIAEEEPPKPSTRILSPTDPDSVDTDEIARRRSSDLASLRKRIRGDLDWVVMKALEKDRTRRYQSAGEFALDIERFRNDEPVLAGPPSARYRVGKFVRRNRLAVTAATVVGLTLVAATVVSLTLAAVAESRKREAVAAQAEAAARARESDAVTEFLAEMLAAADPQEMGFDVTVREVVDTAAPRIRREFAEQPAIQWRLYMALAEVYRSLAEFDSFFEYARLAGELAERSFDAGDNRILASDGALAMALRSTGMYEDAIELQEQVVADYRRIFGEDHRDTIEAVYLLGIYYRGDSRFEDSLNTGLEALELARAHLAPDHAQTLRSMTAAGQAFVPLGRFDEALELLRDVYEVYVETVGEADHATIVARTSIAEALRAAGQIQPSIREFEEIVEISERIYGADHEDTLRAKDWLSTVYVDVGRYAEALILAKAVLAARREAHGERHPATIRSMHQVANHLGEINAPEEAVPVAEEAYELATEVLGDDHVITVNVRTTLATAYRRSGRVAESLPIMREILEYRERIAGPDHSSTLGARTNLGVALRQAGQLREAEDTLSSTLDRMREVLGMDHRFTRITMEALAGLYELEERYDEALPLRRTVLEWRVQIAQHPDADPGLIDRASYELLHPQHAELRDPELALELSVRAVALSRERDDRDLYRNLDTLAMALFATGDAAEAVKVQTEALGMLAPDNINRPGFEERLAQYEEAANH